MSSSQSGEGDIRCGLIEAGRMQGGKPGGLHSDQ